MIGKSCYLMALVLAAGLVQNASGQCDSCVWTGLGSNDLWNNPTNWSCGGLPIPSLPVLPCGTVVLAPTNGSW